MQSDDIIIQQDVLAELRWDPSITDQGIGATVKAGVVTLRGDVPSYREKRAAERAAERVAGVRAVVQEIEVHVPTSVELSDEALAVRAASALDWAVQVPKGTVKPRIERGWVTLEGTVKYGYQRLGAESVVRDLAGLRGITNNVKVEPPSVSPTAVRNDIEQALKRQAELNATRISIDATDGRVTLRGAVSSWAERRAAEHAAWSTPGVTNVDDRLAVITG